MQSKKIKIGFLLENNNVGDIDCRFPNKGNPGVGGTEFCTLIVSYYLKRNYTDKLDITIYANYVDLLPEGIRVRKIENNLDAIEKAKYDDIDIFVLRTTNDINVYNKIEKCRLKCVTWGHNFYLNDMLEMINKCDYVVRNVCVGIQQYDRIIDHEVINKSTTILNMFEAENNSFYSNDNEKNVTYIGSIVPSKGFHVLAKYWKDIIREVPEAKLKVLGNGMLYNRNEKMGTYNIAEEKYEESFMHYLLGPDGKILPSVEFLGLMGSEKTNIYNNTYIGIVNPTAKTEICSISAIEMQACGIPVISKAKNGMLDVIIDNKTGRLIKRENELSKAVVDILKDKNKRNKLGLQAKEFVQERFEPNKISEQWMHLFIDICEDKKQNVIMPKDNFFYDFKIIRIINMKIKQIELFRRIPSLNWYETKVFNFYKKIK